jgi:hypothetical protein
MRVISKGGQDGLVVVHFPIETEIILSETDANRVLIRFPCAQNVTEYVYDFITFTETSVADLAEFN